MSHFDPALSHRRLTSLLASVAAAAALAACGGGGSSAGLFAHFTAVGLAFWWIVD